MSLQRISIPVHYRISIKIWQLVEGKNTLHQKSIVRANKVFLVQEKYIRDDRKILSIKDTDLSDEYNEKNIDDW